MRVIRIKYTYWFFFPFELAFLSPAGCRGGNKAVRQAPSACMIQLTSNKEREGSHAFYKHLGFGQSHLGYKKMLM